MNDQPKTLEEIHAILATLRESSSFRNKFPKKIWNSIIELTKTLPLQEVCRRLNIQPAYLKRKIQQLQNTHSETIDFQEVSFGTHETLPTDDVVIELISISGLKARIQGPSTCLTYLTSLFGGK